jgi:hypothetical protein
VGECPRDSPARHRRLELDDVDVLVEPVERRRRRHDVLAGHGTAPPAERGA